MPRVAFTPNLQRHVSCPPMDVAGTTVREALEYAFAAQPRLERYILDDAGGLRPHMVVFVDGTAVRDRERLSDPVTDRAEILVMQALSGG